MIRGGKVGCDLASLQHLSLSRLNHRLPRGQAHPKVVQGIAEFHHPIAGARLPQAHTIFHDTTALDTAVDMLNPQPTLIQRAVRYLLTHMSSWPRRFLVGEVVMP
jgi:hypothetical protein